MTAAEAGAVSVRPPRPEEADEIARVHLEVWRDASRGILPDEVLAAHTLEAYRERWRTNLLGAGRWVTLAVAEAEGRIVGLASACPDPHDAAHTLLWTLYLQQGARGAGVGRQLVDAVLGDAAPCALWVLDGNDRAIEFYRHLGFALNGETQEERAPSGFVVRERRMVRVNASA